MHDVTILNDVVLTLYTHLASLADSGFRAIFQVVVVLDNLCTDEAFLKVGMDDTSTLRSLPTLLVRPGFYLHLTSGDEGFEVQQGVGFLDEAVDTTLFQTQLFHVYLHTTPVQRYLLLS